jgi:hypothetical protein
MMASGISRGVDHAVQAAVSSWPPPIRAVVRLASAVAAFVVVGAIVAVEYDTGSWKIGDNPTV